MDLFPKKQICASVLALLGLVLSARAQAAYAPIGTIAIDADLPQDQYDQLVSDWAELERLKFSQPDPALLKMMKIPDATSSSLIAWLQARVHYLVRQNVSLGHDVTEVELPFTYPNEPDPVSEKVSAVKKPGRVYMFNLGGGLYEDGKEDGTLVGLQIPGSGLVAVKTPRVGIIQVGESMFAKDIKAMAGLAPDSPVRLIFRLGTLFHEARHSDGHGVSRSFFHAVCPDGPYAGLAACDRSSNGPYSIEAAFLRSALRSCENCTAAEQSVLGSLALDAQSRVIAAGAADWDDAPEPVLEAESAW